MQIGTRIKLVFIIFSAVLILLTSTMWAVLNNSDQLKASQESRYASYQLAEQFRQSSDDLTRMVRTYTVTGDIRFKHYFETIVAIRNGEVPRPSGNQNIFWDLITASHNYSPSNTPKVAMKYLMEELQFSRVEFATLSEAKALSDNLINMEVEAFNMMIGLYKDENGLYTLQGEPNRERARQIVYSPSYHQEKAKIMSKLDEFFVLLELRTKSELEDIQTFQKQLFTSVVVVISLLILFSISGYFYFKRDILVRVNALLKAVNKIRIGHYDLEINKAGDDELDVLTGAMIEMAAATY